MKMYSIINKRVRRYVIGSLKVMIWRKASNFTGFYINWGNSYVGERELFELCITPTRVFIAIFSKDILSCKRSAYS
jgi:hypothetical protein